MDKKLELKTKDKIIKEQCNEEYNFKFTWDKIINEHNETKEWMRIYEWLYPIKFCTEHALILNRIQNNIFYVMEQRKKAFRVIALEINMNIEEIHENIEEIQNLLIHYNKVKVCENGEVLIMNEI